MIEEPGQVVAVEAGAVRVQTRRSSSCSSCSAAAGCGEGVLERLGIQQRHAEVLADTDLQLQVGDPVVIGIPEELLLWSSVQLYLLPLLGLLLGSLAIDAMKFGELATICGGLTGMLLVWAWVRQRVRRCEPDLRSRPRVLRAGIALHGLPVEDV